ncbi:S41 family peptidase [Marinomonas dokdonensis]|uniref:S41 family peptidase n=1 Tax=Marinomonas dokdonensis TaxID=328224 RepID=UPI00405544BE
MSIKSTCIRAFASLSFALLLSVSATAAEGQSPIIKIQSFVEAFETIREGYVEVLSDEEVMQKALKGMVSALDPHSEYFTEEELAEFNELTSGKYAGIGIEVEFKDKRLTIITPIDNSSAAHAGILPGDVIVKIDHTLITDLTMQDIVNLMRGEIGSTVHLDIERGDESLEFDVERRLVQENSVTSKWLKPGLAYFRISQFQSNSDEDLYQAIEDLQSEGEIESLVLDLRNNPGGILQSAVGVVDAFIDKGLIVYTDGRHEISKNQYLASLANTRLLKAPMVVLVNEGSASASEIVAGALQDHGRAIIIGVETFGKGSVQTIVPLSNGDAVKITTALYYTPNRRSIQAQGIVPDLTVPQAKLTVDTNHFFVKESELKGHLSNGTGGEEYKSSHVATGINELSQTDYQLYQATLILQSLPKLYKTQ